MDNNIYVISVCFKATNPRQDSGHDPSRTNGNKAVSRKPPSRRLGTDFDVGWRSRRGDRWPDNVWNDLFLADMVATFIIFAVAGLGVP